MRGETAAPGRGGTVHGRAEGQAHAPGTRRETPPRPAVGHLDWPHCVLECAHSVAPGSSSSRGALPWHVQLIIV